MAKSERYVFYISIMLLVSVNLSFRWPVSNIRITSTFGESRTDHFHDGIDLISYDSRVFPVFEGDMIYFWNAGVFPFEQETGSGNFAVISHEKYNSVYIHLDKINQFQEHYSTDSIIGRFANSGRSYGNHVHLGMFEKGTWDSLNALTVMSGVEDKRPPVIGYFALHIDDDYVILNSESKIRLTKNYPLLVQAFDEITAGDRHGIYRLEVMMNDRKIHDVTFDRMNVTDDALLISGMKFDQVYDGKDYYKIPVAKYMQGINVFDVRAYDYAGNMALKRFVVDVNLDM